ncbi:TIGR03564 family F420-dependent LLM class oxidoreductase [Amycolatopsis xylanica]|uniref:TIGR03564 family F420-dependent LLM class oxidoreductase n=1 Tax=Amycolatopsis xylanica TaxID=589385 RepID=UPI0015A2FCE1|nr:TIGR03564 family F420-dependent LLM class oxidoreductase [Amycolatopsis xylanica]
MRIGLNIDGGRDYAELLAKIGHASRSGYSAAWLPQSPGGGPRKRSGRDRRHKLFGYDSLTALAVAGTQVDGIELGTCVLPTYSRHPMVMAEQALTCQAGYGGTVTLGIGVSHRHVVEDQWGYSYDRTAKRMAEYVTVLNSIFETGEVHFEGETVTARGSLSIAERKIPILVAALGPKMLDVAGELTDGVITWMTGPRTLDEHTVPRLTAAAERAGRTRPRVVASLPVCVTEDAETARELAARMFLIYRSLPNYKAMLDREDADHGGDISLVGTEDEIAGAVKRLAEIGVTDLNALVIGSEEEQARAHALLPELTSGGRENQ